MSSVDVLLKLKLITSGEARAALTEAIDALEKVGQVQAIRDRVEKLSPSDYFKRYDSIPIELTASIKSDLIGFIDSLDKSE